MSKKLLTTHRTTIIKNFATLIFHIGIERKFNLGKLVFEHIFGHVENTAYWKEFGYPSLNFGILTTQKLELVTSMDILRPLLTNGVEELKKLNTQDSIFSMSKGDDDKWSIWTLYRLMTLPPVWTPI